MSFTREYDPVKNQTKYYDDKGKLFRSDRGDTTSNEYFDIDDPRNKKSSGSGSSGGSSGGYSAYDDMYEEQKKALLASLKSGISKAKSGYQNVINTAGQTYQPLKNQVSLGKEQQLQTLREALANQGNRGGTGRQALLNTETAAGNQLNDINLQQQNTVNEAQTAINNLDTDYAQGKKEIEANLASQKLQEIIANQNKADSLAADQQRWQQEFDAKYNQQQFENQLAQQEMASQQAADRLKNEISSIGAYSNDYMAEIQKRQGTADTADDALIPFLNAARNEKIAAQLAQADNSANQAYKNAYEMWKQLGVATSDIAQILNIPVGSKTVDKIKTDYSTSKPYYAPKASGGNSSSGGYGLNW